MNDTILELLQLLPEEEIENIAPEQLDLNHNWKYEYRHNCNWGIVRIRIDLRFPPTHWFDFIIHTNTDEIPTDINLDMDDNGAKSIISLLNKLSTDKVQAYNMLWQLKLCGKMLGKRSN